MKNYELNYEDTLTTKELNNMLDDLAEKAAFEHMMETYGFPF